MERQKCQARTQRGRPCRAAALPGSLFCARHGGEQTAGGTGSGGTGAAQQPSLLNGVLEPDEVERLARLTAEAGPADIIPVIVHALHEALRQGSQPKDIMRICDSYLRAQVAKHRISKQTARSFERVLEDLLDTIVQTLGEGE